MSRATTILGRFPRHFEADKPGKLLGDVVAALARDLNVQSAQIGAVRRAHRVKEAATLGDLFRIAALHDIRRREVDILTMRMARISDRATALANAAEPDRAEAVEALMSLFALTPESAALDAFTPEGGDEAAALTVLLDAVAEASDHDARRRAMSRRIIDICHNHSRGNGTVRALLQGTANALDMDIQAVFHSEDRFVHAAEVLDRITLTPEAVAAPEKRIEVLGLEENPRRRAEQAPAARTHAELFPILRKGFEASAMEIRIMPEADKGVGPMVVNRDQGRGVGFAGTVPEGQTLTITEAGRAMIGGTDVTAFAFGFDGAVFADATAEHPTRDATFDTATFVTSTPAGALDRGFSFPHAGLSIPMPEVAVGKTRMAFFVQEAHYGLAADPPDRMQDTIVTPRTTAGRFSGSGARLGSVFAPGPDEERTPSALVGFAWQEREAYKVRVLIPPRFRELSDDPEGTVVTRRVTDALDRFRPAGVTVETRFIDDRWILGESAINDETGGEDALIALSGGMVLWPSPEETDPPGPTE